MKLDINIKTPDILGLGERDLKKLKRALEIIIQTSTGKIPDIDIKVMNKCS